jgi:hypothetical protein
MWMRVPPRVRQGIEFVAHDDSNGELRITGDDATRGCCCGARSGLMSTASG